MTSGNLKQILNFPLKILLILLFSIVMSLIIFLFFLIWIPTYIWRQFAIFLTSKLCSKKFGRILSPMDVLSHVPNPVEGAPQASLVCTAVLQRDLTINQVRELFLKLIVDRLISNDKSTDRDKSVLRYPELRQYEVDWLGFRFLKWDEEFSINNHITEFGVSPTVSNIAQVHAELINRKFDSKKSPWEVVIFRGIVGEGGGGDGIQSQTLIGLRIHHTIADGLSLLKLFVECLGGKRLVKANRSILERGRVEELQFYLKLPFALCKNMYQYWRDAFIHYRQGRGGRLGLSGSGSGNNVRRVVVGVTPKIRMNDVKNLTKVLGATSSSIIMAGIIGGFGRLAKGMGYDGGGKESMGYILPVDGHPDGFANHWRTTYTRVSLDTAASPLTRIQSCKQAFLKMKTGTLAHFFRLSIFCIGTSTTILSGKLLRNQVCSFGITNIAGEEEGFFVGGTECLDFCLSSGGIPGISLMFCVMSYRNYFRVSCVAEENEFMTESRVNELARLIYQEFQDFFVICGGESV